MNLATKAIDGGKRGGAQLVQGNPRVVPGTITPDDRELIFVRASDENWLDLWSAPLEVGASSVTVGEATLLLGTPHLEVFPAVSPDGGWIAYTSDETDRWEIYVTTYPDLKKRVRVSSNGGEEARWNPDGSELIYRWSSQWFVVDVSYEPEFRCSKPRLVFEGPYINLSGYSWDMSSDGERFLVVEGTEQNKALTELVVLTRFLDRLP